MPALHKRREHSLDRPRWRRGDVATRTDYGRQRNPCCVARRYNGADRARRAQGLGAFFKLPCFPKGL
jgi:hypothetical protein